MSSKLPLLTRGSEKGMRPLPRYLPALLALAATTGGQAYAQKPDSEKPKAESPTFKKATGDLSKLKFMAGCWQGPLDQDTQVEEIWTTPSENLLVATTRILKKGRAIEFEFTRIRSEEHTSELQSRSDLVC